MNPSGADVGARTGSSDAQGAESEEESVEDLLREADNLRKCAQLVSSLGQRVTLALLDGPCLWFDAPTVTPI